LIASGAEPNETWQVGAFSDSDDSDEKESLKTAHNMTSDLEQLFSAIRTANTHLMKLSVVIRNSLARDDYLKAAARYNFDPKYDIGHVKEKHGSARTSREWLTDRLGKAITRRRQYLKYRQDHHGKLSKDWDDITEKTEEKPEKTVASTKSTTSIESNVLIEKAGSGVAESLGSQTSYEPTTIGDSTVTRLNAPPHPKLAFEGVPFRFGEPFQCPYCYTEQTVKNRSDWKYVIPGIMEYAAESTD
jgi:hypothetical protein